MRPGLFVGAALLLAIERIAYIVITRHPAWFVAWCSGSIVRRLGQPLDVVRVLFVAFKLIQAAVFAAWIYVHGDGNLRPADGSASPLAAGALLIAVGQLLNLGVFFRLGRVGVFYGRSLGHDLAPCRAFPFSVFSHPQYVGTVLSIWGLFLITRFPHRDWLILPALETAYYALGARLEQ
jgi:phosphatidyl-N-methylethanolamine N-methyltransferase